MIPTVVSRALGDMLVARNSIALGFQQETVRLRPTPSCDQGCSHCCYWPVAISILEGLDIYENLCREHKWTAKFQEKLRAAADTVTGLDYTVWLHSSTPCVFLKDGRCEIYASRPLLCRTAVSNGPPEGCRPCAMWHTRSIIKRTEPMALFQNAERGILQTYGVEYHTMPIPTAVLAAARIGGGDLELWQAGAAVFAEHLGRM